MTRAEATGEEPVRIIESGELRLTEVRQRHVRRYISCLHDGLLRGALAPSMAQEKAA